jgi:hypothetical protein
MGLARILVDIYGVSAAVKNVTTSLAKVEAAHVSHHIKTSSLLNATKAHPRQSPTTATQPIDNIVESRLDQTNTIETEQNKQANSHKETRNALLKEDVGISTAAASKFMDDSDKVLPDSTHHVEPMKNDISEKSTVIERNIISQEASPKVGDSVTISTKERLSSIATNFEQVVQDQVEEEPQRRVLKSSRIPTSRTSRLWHYGSLATAMGFGAMNESIKRMTGVSKGEGGK